MATVIVAVMIPPIMLLAEASGANSAQYALPVASIASGRFLLPLDAMPLITFSKGYYNMQDMLYPGAVISLLWVLPMAAVVVLVGPPVGLL